MKYLFLNQSFYPTISLLFSEDSLIYSVVQFPDESSPNNLLYITKVLFDLLKVDKKELSGVFVVYGPGSFTGTRISVVDAKILAYALSIPLYPVNSLELIAKHVSGKITSILSASRNEFFIADFEDGKRLTEDRIASIEELKNASKKLFSFEKISSLEVETIYPENDVIIKHSLEILQSGQFVKDPLSLKPLYLRAEDKLFKKMRW